MVRWERLLLEIYLSGLGSQESEEGDLALVVDTSDGISGLVADLGAASHVGHVSVGWVGGDVSSAINNGVVGSDASPGPGSGEVAVDLDGVLVATRSESKILARSDWVLLGTGRSLHRSDGVLELSESKFLVAHLSESFVSHGGIHRWTLLATSGSEHH